MKVKEYIQNMGRSLMLPVATLPAAAIFVGIANWIKSFTGGDVVSTFLFFAGLAVLANLGLLFAVGLAYGMSRDHDGAAALAGLVGFLTPLQILDPASVAAFRGFENADKFKEALPEVAAAFGKIGNGNVFIGIIAGLIAAAIYNRFHTVKLPAALSFFSGKRLVPILSVGFMAIVSLVLLFVWPAVFQALTLFGESVMGLGPIGAGIYAFFNRLLIPTGLHHALNNVFWFDIAGINDIGRFWDPNFQGEAVKISGYYPGMYQAGFFPIMMFGLPAGAFAIYRNARPERRKAIGSIMLAAAIASFFTGVTEPLEFSFMFVAFPLYVVHALLTGLAVAITAFMGWASGFNFSAGFVDYVLAYPSPNAKMPYMLLVEGVIFAVLYYFIFSFAIKTFNLQTPGREPEDEVLAASASGVNTGDDSYLAKAKAIYAGLGGDQNVTAIDYCTTRLRAVVKDMNVVNQGAIKATGIPAVNVVGDNNIQVIVGTDVQFVHDQIQAIRGTDALDQTVAVKPADPIYAVSEGTFKPLSAVSDQAFASGSLGDGYAVTPSTDQVYAPADAQVVSIFPAKHAVILRTGDGVEMLVHMGIDTVELKGEPFQILVNKGDQLAAGAPLATMDINAVKQAGKETDILVVFPQRDQIESLQLTAAGQVRPGEQVGTLVAKVKVG